MLHNYSHFNPTKHSLDVKIAQVKSGFHCKYNINYHLVWIPKYRKIMLRGRVKEVLEDIIRGQCKELNLDCLALEIMPDHLHLFVGAKPTHVPCDIVKKIKGNTSIQLRRVFPQLKYLYKPYRKQFPSLWARGYYCGSAGHVSQEAVARYIAEQEGKEVFEYSIFGDDSGQSKIGNFTQSKLEGVN
jgi:putative transposase